MVNFYHRFLPGIAAALSPLHALVAAAKSPKTKLVWDELAVAAYERSEEKLFSPLHLVIMKSGLRSYARLQGQLDRKLAGITSNTIKKNSHKMYWEKLASEANIELKNSDVICETMREKKYKVNLKSFDGKMKHLRICLLYTSPSPRDLSTSRMPSSA